MSLPQHSAAGPSRAEATADVLGLLALALALGDYLRPSLLVLDTYPAGGDLASHYPTAVFLRDHLLPQGRLHGWYAGAYLGQPLLLYYFPLPFLLMAALAAFLPMTVAFKLGTALAAFLLPACAYVSFRLLGFRFPAPLLAATGAHLFLLVEENPIWGGPIASTLAGEFCYSYGIALATLFVGLAYRSYAKGRRPFGPAVLLALTALAHGYAVLWAGLSASYFLHGSRRPLRTLVWLAALATLAAGLAGFWLLPLLWDWRYTTPFNDPWLTVGVDNLLPKTLLPLFACALAGFAWALLLRKRGGGLDRRLLYLWHAALVALMLAAAGPALGVVDVRFLPFAQLALALAGCASLGLALLPLRARPAAALGVVLLAIAWGDSRSVVTRYWAEYDYAGLQAKELWPAWKALNERLRGSLADPRVAIEYSTEHERAGSIRMYETLPFFSGRSTLEGAYNQASLNTHAVYYLQSLLGERSPNPFKSVEFGVFDTEAALQRLRLFGADTIVALSDKLASSLAARSDVEPLAAAPPYRLFRAKQAVRYVEPLACAPVRSGQERWREKAQRWFTRVPLGCAPLVFSSDPRAGIPEEDEWLAPPTHPLPEGVVVRESLGPEEIRIETSRVGHPLLVKVSWHPRWRVEGADGPYRVAPALMMVVPRAHEVTLRYGPSAADSAGRAVSGLTLLGLVLLARRGLRAPALAQGGHLPLRIRLILFGEEAPSRRWGWLVPAAALLVLAATRLLPESGAAARRAEGVELRLRADGAAARGRHQEAAEYARHALPRLPHSPERTALALLRGDSLLAAGRPAEAREAFRDLLREGPEPPAAARARRGMDAATSALARELGTQ